MKSRDKKFNSFFNMISSSWTKRSENNNKQNIRLLFNNDNLKEFYPKGTIFVINKREKNFQQLLKETQTLKAY